MLDKLEMNSLVNAETGKVSRRIFVDQALYEQELEQVFARSWLYVAHESQIPNPVDFVSAYMGEDPVLVIRDSRGKINAFLNTCRHRGMRVCRADEGNAAAFTCTYHGWTYGNDGKLVGVPGYKEYYYEELDMEQWGLVPVTQVDTYKGLIFGTFDAETPPLREFLGDMAYYLDRFLDKREGGTEIIGGTHKWVVQANWKLAAENFIGDSYHFPVTHASTIRVRSLDQSYRGRGFSIRAGFGHGVLADWPVEPHMLFQGSETAQRYMIENLPEMAERLGADRMKLRYGAGGLFPNMAFLDIRPQIMVFHPRGPQKTEVWAWCFVDKAASPEVKEALRLNMLRGAGPGGITEQDDMENWNMCTASSRGFVASHHDFNYALALGREHDHEQLPGSVAPRVSEHNQRGFYGSWAKLMAGKSWSQVR